MQLDPKALAALKNHQRQLDNDGVEVGVSRQALDELIAAYLSASSKAQPVAWRWRRNDATGKDWEAWTFLKIRPTWLEDDGFTVEPLYTHPAPQADAVEAELAKVRAERDAFEQCCEDWQNDAAEACGVAVRLQALLDEAVKVIEPFAKEADGWEGWSDNEPLTEDWPGGPATGLKVKHLRTARAPLDKIRGQG